MRFCLLKFGQLLVPYEKKQKERYSLEYYPRSTPANTKMSLTLTCVVPFSSIVPRFSLEDLPLVALLFRPNALRLPSRKSFFAPTFLCTSTNMSTSARRRLLRDFKRYVSTPVQGMGRGGLLGGEFVGLLRYYSRMSPLPYD
jgi:hypothetical protein